MQQKIETYIDEISDFDVIYIEVMVPEIDD
jgi:hypothetical protein